MQKAVSCFVVIFSASSAGARLNLEHPGRAPQKMPQSLPA
jgi:hypothetical protein